MNPVTVIEALHAAGICTDKLEAIGERIIAVESVSVADLAMAGLAGRDIIAVRRALAAPVSPQVGRRNPY